MDPVVLALLDRLRQGDTHALGLLLEECRPWLMTKADGYLPPKLKAKLGLSDIVQDTCKAVHESIQTFHGNSIGELHGWIASILDHKAKAHITYYQTEIRNIHREQQLNASHLEDTNSLRSRGQSPETNVVRIEEIELLQDAINKIPFEMRLVLRLRYHECLMYSEIATRIGKSEGATKKIWARAIKLLQSIHKSR